MSQDDLEYEDEEFDDSEFDDNDSEDGDKGNGGFEGSSDSEFEEDGFEDDSFEDDGYYDDGKRDPDDDGQDAYFPSSSGDQDDRPNRNRYRDEIYSRRVPAGKRTYFFDVKTTRSGKDYFLTITESKKVGENRYEKHKLFLYKEDFGKFVTAMHEVIDYIKEECLPDYEFRGLPEVSKREGEQDEDWSDEEGSY